MPFVELIPGCEQCGEISLQPGIRIKRCSRCSIVGYCSVSCQREGWKAGHKFECIKPEDIDMQQPKAVSRLRLGASSDADSQLYYLRISRPWINNILLFGPFPKIEETYMDIARNLRFSRSGMLYFDQMYKEKLVDQVVHIRAPLDADKNKEILIEILLHNDQCVKEKLPCPVWNVVCMTPVERLKLREGPPQVVAMELVGSFLSEAEAEAVVERETKEQASHFSLPTSATRRVDGPLSGVVAAEGKVKRIIQILYDSGEPDQSQIYVGPKAES